MQIPTGKLPVILSEIDTVLNACTQANAGPATSSDSESGLGAMLQALQQLADVLTRIESDAQSSSDIDSEDSTGIGEYALQLLESLSTATEYPTLTGQQQTLASLAINMALWIARHNGQISTLEPVVNALALFANSIREPAELELLSAAINDIVAAVSSIISQDIEKTNLGRPWRVLLLNHSIIATRSHNTALMEAAFEALTRKLPEDATRFFSEGMDQMDALNYPAHVRKLMEKYHREWPANHPLH